MATGKKGGVDLWGAMEIAGVVAVPSIMSGAFDKLRHLPHDQVPAT